MNNTQDLHGSFQSPNDHIKLILPPGLTEDQFFMIWNKLTDQQKQECRQFIKITKNKPTP